MFNSSLNNAYGIEFRQLKWPFGKKLKSTRLKDRSGFRKTKRTQENINLLQENLIEGLRISATMNGLEITESIFNQITKRELKWNPYMMHVRNKRNNNYKWSWFTERKSGFIIMRRRVQVCLQRNGGDIEGNWN